MNVSIRQTILKSIIFSSILLALNAAIETAGAGEKLDSEAAALISLINAGR